MTDTSDSGSATATEPEQYTRHNAPDVEGPPVSREQEYEVVLLVRAKGFGTTTHQDQTAYTVAKELSEALGQDAVHVFRTQHMVVYSDQSAYMETDPVLYDPYVHDGHHPRYTPWWEKTPDTDGD